MSEIKGYVSYLPIETLQWDDKNKKWDFRNISLSELKQREYIRVVNMARGHVEFVKADIVSQDYEGEVYHIYLNGREIISYIYGQNLFYSVFLRRFGFPYIEEREFEKFEDKKWKNGEVFKWTFSQIVSMSFSREYDQSIKNIDDFVNNYNRCVKCGLTSTGEPENFTTTIEQYKGKIYNIILPYKYAFISRNVLMTGWHV